MCLVPRWLVQKSRREKAVQVLSRIRCCSEQEVSEELNEIVQSSKSSEQGVLDSFKTLVQWRVFQRYTACKLACHYADDVLLCRVLIGVGLQLFQQFTGMNVIM